MPPTSELVSAMEGTMDRTGSLDRVYSVGEIANIVMPPRNKSAVRKNYNFLAVRRKVLEVKISLKLLTSQKKK